MRRMLAVLPLLTLISCATVMTGRHENIEVNSSPPGADAVLTCVNGSMVRGVTPVTMQIRRNAGECQLQVSKQGFRDNHTTLVSGINGTFWGNFGFMPLAAYGPLLVAIGSSAGNGRAVTAGTAMIATAIGVFLVDYHSGAMRKHEPTRVDAVLTPNP
jgi:hypothetical protein